MPAAPGPRLHRHDIAAAFGLLTRLPVKVNTVSAQSRGAAAAWAYPLVGLATAGCAAGFGALALAAGLAPVIAAGIAALAPVLLTGALHEDGLADCADGFWGGWSRTRRLAIMKDSQIGTYGVLALIFAIGLRWSALTLLLPEAGWPWLIAAACLSRASMVLLMASTPRARPRGLSAAVGRPAYATAAIALALATVLATLSIGLATLPALALTIFTTLACARLARHKIGGQTGDVLGATQVLCDTALLCLATTLI